MTRETLPNRRPSHVETFTYVSAEGMPIADVTLSIGYYAEGNEPVRVGEVFLNTNKIGTMLDTAARDIATTLSLLIQYGCSLRHIRSALTERADGSAEGLAGQVMDVLLRAEKALATRHEQT